MIKNNIPIIALVDNKCGSAGESMLLSLRSLENVIVIGGNSYGAQLCGNMQWYKLPNSGMNVAFGRSNGGRLSNGKLSLKAVQIDEKIPITITYKGKKYVFYANS